MSNMSNVSFPPQIGNYLLGQPLGSGVSGSTFRATHIHTGQAVALKVQPVDISYPTNTHERKIYPLLQGGVGMPTLWASGVWGRWDYLAMDLLGSSLDRLYRKAGKNVMDLRSACSIAIQLISRLEFMHSRGVLHRDVQLGNCVIGLEPRNGTIYMIDFGFAKRYLDHKQKHIANRTERSFIGNYWFSSVNVHCRGKTCSRRDDLESAALLLLHVLTPGGLPWTRSGVPRDDVAHDRLKREKRGALPEDLARGLPEEFEEFLRYCRSLNFTQQPDYAHWRKRFHDLANDLGCTHADKFIWPPPPAPLRPASRPTKPRSHQSQFPDAYVAGLLQGLARLNINKESLNRPVLGDKKNVQDNGRGMGLLLKKPEGTEIIVISDGEQGPVHRYNKAARIVKLTQAAGQAADNRVLAQITANFVKVLQDSNSRTLTREGFAFLDALHKQLADPSVFIIPLRTSKTRSSRSQEEEEIPGEDAPHERRNRLNILRTSLAKAQDNKTLARLVADFGTLIDRAAGRKLTKDSIAFLESMADRLQVVVQV
ncbi:kinase-like domain-containing protein [Multifurca ochricompacta]|uniref:Kinase-like domain-containing protein n=1 Tax=Multifurca ochricompacta TaxID=376703 RepID=A0AAD4M790_9AGAM|nr:kinase-like domain-containing protein [Multifurca ochricompacta]